MIEKTRYTIIATVLMLSLFLCSIAFAADTYTYGFEQILEENEIQNDDGRIGEAQMSFSVSLDEYENKEFVVFTFYNIGSEDSSITNIYFDDDVPLLVFASDAGVNKTGFEYPDGGGVAFSEGASPQNLPGGNELFPQFSSNYEYDSDSEVQPNGVNPGEWVKLYFTLSTNNTYPFQALIDALDKNSFRVGIKVQGFEDEGSEAFVNGSETGGGAGGGSAVPEPATLLLFGFGMLGAAGISRKKIFLKN